MRGLTQGGEVGVGGSVVQVLLGLGQFGFQAGNVGLDGFHFAFQVPQALAFRGGSSGLCGSSGH